MWIRFTPEYLAGMVVGFGLALFGLFLVTLIEEVASHQTYRSTIGAIGIFLLIAGGFWKLRIQSSQRA